VTSTVTQAVTSLSRFYGLFQTFPADSLKQV